MKLAMFPIPLKTLQLCRERNFLTSPTEFRAGGTACPLPVRYRYWLLLSAVGWFALTTTPWFGGFFVLICILEYQAKRPLEIGFNDDRIAINNIVRQWYDWSALNNVVLKDGLLTLDFKNNRLLQKEVADDDEEDDADEEEFNSFCRSRLVL